MKFCDNLLPLFFSHNFLENSGKWTHLRTWNGWMFSLPVLCGATTRSHDTTVIHNPFMVGFGPWRLMVPKSFNSCKISFRKNIFFGSTKIIESPNGRCSHIKTFEKLWARARCMFQWHDDQWFRHFPGCGFYDSHASRHHSQGHLLTLGHLGALHFCLDLFCVLLELQPKNHKHWAVLNKNCMVLFERVDLIRTKFG